MTPDIATRAEGLKRLAAFAPRMGRAYAQGRNFDHGSGRHDHVSCLSPYLRDRLVTEREVVAAALSQHGPEAAEKFVQEVLWRGYFKGWLERRPSIWSDYVAGLTNDIAVLETDSDLRTKVTAAQTGDTGLACFDAWARELVETGYLHNHARMWFASIWIFTFGLPWRLGADFFFRHLIDGDPASNTCSWRWVAGLHTPGKTYAAQAWNIAKFTDGRFTPTEGELDGVCAEVPPVALPEVSPLRPVTPPAPGVPTALLLTEDDCSLNDFDLAALDIRATGTLPTSHLRSALPVSEAVSAFERAALRDTATRAGLDAPELAPSAPDSLAAWASANGAQQIALPYAPTGPLADWLAKAGPSLAAQGITLTEWRRDWDAAIWPHATAGFFKVKKKLPDILHLTGLL